MEDIKKLLADRIDVIRAKRSEASRNKLAGVQVLLFDELEKELSMIMKRIDDDKP